MRTSRSFLHRLLDPEPAGVDGAAPRARAHSTARRSIGIVRRRMRANHEQIADGASASSRPARGGRGPPRHAERQSRSASSTATARRSSAASIPTSIRLRRGRAPRRPRDAVLARRAGEPARAPQDCPPMSLDSVRRAGSGASRPRVPPSSIRPRRRALPPPRGRRSASAAGRPSGRPSPPRPARTGDIASHLDGIGTVTPRATVTVRTRVDGELVAVALPEGQHVARGDLLAEIDPRPFQVQLAQAEGQLARDQALLANAQVDLTRYRAPRQGRRDPEAAARHAGGARAPVRRRARDRPRADRRREAEPRLQPRQPSPVDGPDRAPPRRSGQHRPRDRRGRASRVVTQLQPIDVVFPIPEDALPGRAGEAALGRAAQPSTRSTARRDAPRARGYAPHDRQHDRSRDRHRAPEGRVPERRRRRSSRTSS